MEIRLNDKLKEIDAGLSLDLLLKEIMPDRTRGIAVAVNNQVVPKTSWDSYYFNPNDDILIINATQGG